MNEARMVLLGVTPTSNHISEMFLLDIPCYKLNDFNGYLCQYDLRKNKDLRKKNLWYLLLWDYVGDEPLKINVDTIISDDALDQLLKPAIEDFREKIKTEYKDYKQ